ncbi:MAG: glycine--tRNA ligase subunit beta [SAR86 cluster bacterium]|uniref:Glycine--tRNA ligase beta subunit n=1 Tax=SAR86 cluster bacterium TaxID=2030880 RepID=A0A2A5AZM7_9GAMM|nr:MAG: glycine--tRNA ligase subunit beta [SAR86 cluster bacterium]
MSKRNFLVEIGTEELPPKALNTLAKAFEAGIVSGLQKEQLSFTEVSRFATPRRLAVIVNDLDENQADKKTERFGPALKAAYDADNNPTPAAIGFAKSCGVELADLGTATKDGVEKLTFSSVRSGKSTQELLPAIVENALSKLPIPKRMRWGSSRNEFVRPVHWIVLLFGSEKIPATIMGVESASYSYGHRFHYNQKIQIPQADDYQALLENPGCVIADYNQRKEMIRLQIEEEGKKLGATTVIDKSLLEEVTGLVEFPVALAGKFEEHYLEVPAEALILAMKSHQKCFYLVDEESRLLPLFITVSNIRSKDPAKVIEGNERVIRPRLADARFFFETDKKQTLESRLEQLKKVVFQAKLGTVYDRCIRLSKLSKSIANALGENEDFCERAAMLSKCDLVTNMVGEFADLQGLMGYYYALNDNEPVEVATAINEQYMPRFSGDKLPSSSIGNILAIADKLDSIVGLFAIGQPPTGSKDPFALRRSAIGVLRIMVEKELDIDLLDCIDSSISSFDSIDIDPDTRQKVFEFLLERFRAWYLDEGIPGNIFQSVIALKPRKPLDFHRRIQAVHHFSSLEQAAPLAAANKRVSNLLSKIEQPLADLIIDESLFAEEAEKLLFSNLCEKELNVAPLFATGQYKEGLEQLAQLEDSVNKFFDDVMVMCDEPAVRNNRIAILQRLRDVFLHVADISYLHSS